MGWDPLEQDSELAAWRRKEDLRGTWERGRWESGRWESGRWERGRWERGSCREGHGLGSPPKLTFDGVEPRQGPREELHYGSGQVASPAASRVAPRLAAIGNGRGRLARFPLRLLPFLARCPVGHWCGGRQIGSRRAIGRALGVQHAMLGHGSQEEEERVGERAGNLQPGVGGCGEVGRGIG